MALTDIKFYVSWIVLSAVFISLSVSATAVTEKEVDGHRCYWCGPLAEQVHRSQRASKCNGDKSKMTICDDDLPYCAIVATTPPYVESRFCVKFYQDECYSLYCNTSKTWKTICPCRGELCNGDKTKRETDAFEALLKYNVPELTQNKRLKRALITSASFIGMTTRKNKIDNTTSEEDKDAHKEAISSNLDNLDTDAVLSSNNSVIEMETVTQSSETGKTEGKSNERPKSENNSEVMSNESPELTPESSKNKTEVSSTESSEILSAENNVEVTSNEISQTAAVDPTNTPSTNLIEETVQNSSLHTNTTEMSVGNNDKQIQINLPTANLDTGDLKTEIILMSSEMPNLLNETKTSDMVTETIEIIRITTAKTTLTTDNIKNTPEANTELAKTTLEKTKVKSNEKLPAAEALQHNDTPTTKTTEKMSTNTPTMITSTHLDVATQATMPRNNTAVQVNAHLLPIMIGIILL